jgi:hypothetical protein
MQLHTTPSTSQTLLQTQIQTHTQESLLRLGGLLDLDPLLLYLLFFTGAGLTLALSLPFPFPFGSRLLEYLLLLGAGDLETEAEGLLPRRFGGGERETDFDGLRPRRFGAGERDREGLEV